MTWTTAATSSVRYVQLKPIQACSRMEVLQQLENSSQTFWQDPHMHKLAYCLQRIPQAAAYPTVPWPPPQHSTWMCDLWKLYSVVWKCENFMSISLGSLQDVWVPPIARHAVSPELCRPHGDEYCCAAVDAFIMFNQTLVTDYGI
jgi:hypothetical protein